MPITNDDNYKIVVQTVGDTKGVQEVEKSLGSLSNTSGKSGESFLKLTGAVAAGEAAFNLAKDAIGKTVGIVESSIKAYEESEAQVSQLNAVLTSTKGAAGVTSQAAIDLSKALEKSTAFSDEQVLSAENMLLTFTALKKDAFPQATQAALDMAVALNHGVTPTAEEAADTMKLLGKALQDPDAGLGALHRVGVNVDELKKKFVGVNDIATKQKLILQELGTEFGGSAAAAANTYAGKMQQIKNSMNDVQESIGKTILDALNPYIKKLADFVQSDKFQKWLETLTAWLNENLPKALNYVTHTLLPELKNIFDAIWPAIKKVFEWAGDLMKFLGDHTWVIWGLVGAFAAWKTAMLITDTIMAIGIAFGLMEAESVESMTGLTIAFKAMSATISTPIAITILTAAALAAIGAVLKASYDLKAAWNQASNDVTGAGNAETDFYASLKKAHDAGKISDAEFKRRSTAFANGIQGNGFASGGFTGRGDSNEIAGVVHKGEYVLPQSAVDQNTGQPKQAIGNRTVTIGTIILGTDGAVKQFFKQLDQDSILTSRGLSPRGAL